MMHKSWIQILKKYDIREEDQNRKDIDLKVREDEQKQKELKEQRRKNKEIKALQEEEKKQKELENIKIKEWGFYEKK